MISVPFLATAYPRSPETILTGRTAREYRVSDFARIPGPYRQKFIDSITQFWNSAEAKPMVFGKWSEGIKAEKE